MLKKTKIYFVYLSITKKHRPNTISQNFKLLKQNVIFRSTGKSLEVKSIFYYLAL